MGLQRNRRLEYTRPIKVGNDVWIDGNVVVLSGVTIGDNIVIGVGNFCKVIKKLRNVN